MQLFIVTWRMGTYEFCQANMWGRTHVQNSMPAACLQLLLDLSGSWNELGSCIGG